MNGLSASARMRDLAPGALLAGTIALASQFVASRYGGPVMLYAILFGMAFNFLSEDAKCVAGLRFASKRVLQFGVILLGAAVTLSEIAALGWTTAALVLFAVGATIAGGFLIGRAAGLAPDHSILSAGAVAICGASAAMAISAVLPATKTSERQLVLTVVGVTTVSTIAMVAYPPLALALGFSDRGAGVFLGATIHDVAHVIGAGYLVSEEAAATAAFVKLMRVTLLAPAVFVIALLFSGQSARTGVAQRAFPLFLLGFFALMAANSLGLVAPSARALLGDLSRWCLIIAVSALGVRTSLKHLAAVGLAPLVVLVLQTLFMAALVGAATVLFGGAFNA